MTATRELHTGWAVHNALPDTYLVYAECPDEQTQLILMRPMPLLRDTYLIPEDAMAASEAYRLLIQDHQGRCDSCRAWVVSRGPSRRMPA
jgi:hypothetical protein